MKEAAQKKWIKRTILSFQLINRAHLYHKRARFYRMSRINIKVS